MNEIKKLLPILKTLGLSPDSLGPDKLNKIAKIAKGIKKPQDISMEKSQKIMKILGISGPPVVKKEPKKSSRIKPNEPCPCGSTKKYKKCCRLNIK